MQPQNEPKKSKRYIPETNEFIYQANLQHLNAPMREVLSKVPETPISIDNDIIVQGIKNPLFLVIIGFSTMKLLEACRRLRKHIDFILVIEPNIGRFHQTIKREYLRELYQSETVDLIVGTKIEELYPQIYNVFAMRDNKFGSRATRAMKPEIIFDPFIYEKGVQDPEAKAIYDIVVRASQYVFTSMGCAADTFYRWEQMFRNRENLKTAYNIKHQFNQWSEVPAIVVGGGPSVENFIEAYKKNPLYNKALIIAVDASLRRLLKEGIKPHIIVRCERKLTTIFDGVTPEETKGIYYAAYPWCDPEFFDLFEDKFILFRDNGVCHWTGFSHGSVNGGVSSGNAALQLAYELGCKQIILTGIDLCFLDGKSHVSGTEVEFDPEKSKKKWTQIKGNDGKEVTTIPVWQRCHSEFENSINKYKQKNKDLQIFNTSLQGAKITGAPVFFWDDLQQKIFQVPDIDIVARIKTFIQQPTSEEKEGFDQRVKDAITYCEALKKDLKKLFGGVEDDLLVAKREEEKCLEQVKAIHYVPDLWKTLHEMKKGLANTFTEPCRKIDQFKMQYYTNQQFSFLMLDTCQLDMFITENKAAGLQNLVDEEHERLKMYAALHMNFYRTINYYNDKMIQMLKTGEVNHDPGWDKDIPKEALWG